LLEQLLGNMPKKMSRNKRGKAPMSSRTRPVSLKVDSVKQLLARRATTLTRVTDQVARQQFWSRWLSEHLPVEIRPRISGVSARDGALVVFAETAAWSARLRYVISELEPDIRAEDPTLTAIEVRVLPRS
jgi:hypothetical protein